VAYCPKLTRKKYMFFKEYFLVKCLIFVTIYFYMLLYKIILNIVDRHNQFPRDFHKSQKYVKQRLYVVMVFCHFNVTVKIIIKDAN